MGDGEAAEQATSEWRGEDSGIVTVANTDVRVQTLPGPQRAAAASWQLANEIYRWTVGAYSGSRADKVQDLAGVNDIGVVMRGQRVT